MRVAVWDTYVKRKDGKTMHFDILVPDYLQDVEKIIAFGRKYLEKKPFEAGSISSKECQFCHIEDASPEVRHKIDENGYHIIEMENCLI